METEKKTSKSVSLQLDELSSRLVCGVALIEALAEAIATGNNEPQFYTDAISGAAFFLRGISEDLIMTNDALMKQGGSI